MKRAAEFTAPSRSRLGLEFGCDQSRDRKGAVGHICLALFFSLALSGSAMAADKLFSGPQPGEPLPPFKVLAVNGPDAGREVDFISRYGDAPVLLIFAHYIDRNVYGVLWPCDRYAAERAAAGLKTLYVYL